MDVPLCHPDRDPVKNSDYCLRCMERAAHLRRWYDLDPSRIVKELLRTRCGVCKDRGWRLVYSREHKAGVCKRCLFQSIKAKALQKVAAVSGRPSLRRHRFVPQVMPVEEILGVLAPEYIVGGSVADGSEQAS